MLLPPKVLIDSRTTPEPNTGCWLWLGWCDVYGYGITQRNRRQVRAHRLSWEAYRGSIPDGLQVLHKCDVRCCVNPDHLFVGTHQDNMADMVAKGRSPNNTAENNPKSKLKWDDIRAIRARSKQGHLHKNIAADFGVTDVSVAYIVSGKTWKNDPAMVAA